MKGSCDRSVYLKLSLKKDIFLRDTECTYGKLDRLCGDRS